MDLIEDGLADPIQHWYYKHKFWFIKTTNLWKTSVHPYLVDIGAGSALFSRELIKLGRIEKAVALDTGYSDRQLVTEESIEFCRASDYSAFTHFLMTDVLEHIQDDQEFLTRIVKEAKVGASFLITVPAMKSLWSGHDVYLKHFRRYTKKQLCALIESAGLEVLQVRYIYSTLFPIAFIMRRFFGSDENSSQMKKDSLLVSWILRILLIPDRYINWLPFGVSIYLEAVKNA